MAFEREAAMQIENVFSELTGTSRHCNDAEAVARIMDCIDINHPEMVLIDRVNLLVDYVRVSENIRKNLDKT